MLISISRSGLLLALGLALLLLPASSAIAQENDECFLCHADRDLTGLRDGRKISVYVGERTLARSSHAEIDCILCHSDLLGEELPHADDLEPVDCGMCHDDQATEHDRSLHGKAAARGDRLAPRCTDCHGKHDIRAAADPKSPTAIMNVPLLCGRCHREGSPVSLTHDIPKDSILENYSMSIHGEGLYRQGLIVTAVCTSCHTAHDILPHTDPRSSISRDNVATTCTRCHAQIEEVHRKVIEGRRWEEAPHKIPACVECHQPHKIRRVYYPAGAANKDCLACHSDPESPLYVDEQRYAGSSHAQIACAQCHTEVTTSRARPCETVRSGVDCGACHTEEVDQFQRSIHGRLLAEGDPDAPGCLDCHGKHATQSKNLPASPTFARNVPELCARCHRDGAKAAVRIHRAGLDITESYIDSIHGKGLMESGLVVTATCSSCHGAHLELPASDPQSMVHPDNIADTCGACHHGIEETFRTSIHWSENSLTSEDLPTCEDCHTSHTIGRTDSPGFRLLMMEQCGRCHENEALTFFDTFHGKVSRLGSEGAAKCYDCHGTHDILPPSDPASWLSRDNVVRTCGQCHEGSHRRFAGYLTHATHHDPDKYPYLFYSFWGMTFLLIGTLSLSLMHTLAWLIRLWLSRKQWKRAKPESGELLMRRFSRLQRTMHLMMLLSFFALALTGMTLKFSYMAWAQSLSTLLGGFHAAGILHRVGAIILIIVFVLHFWDVWRQKRLSKLGWLGFATAQSSMIFNLTDLREFWQSLKWFVGLGERPRYGRFTYWEKFDYCAVFWGIAVIGSTGLILWFPEFFTRLMPGWSVNVATIIHSDEALLAVAFIFTIHFFNTHFRPDKFPMDTVIFTGRVSLEELKHDRPREYEEYVATGLADKPHVEPMPKETERAFKFFGFLFLAIGLTMIVLIVYSMIFHYK